MNIIFVCESLYERPIKLAHILQGAGYTPTLIVKNNDFTYEGDCFSQIKLVDNDREFLNVIRSVPANAVIHHFSANIDAFTISLLRTDRRFIYDYKDIFPGILNLLPETTNQSHRAILNLILERSLPIACKDGQLDYFLRAHQAPPYGQAVFIPDLVWPDAYSRLLASHSCAADTSHKLVFLGNFIIESLEPQFSGLGQLKIIESLLNQGFSYDMFPYRHDRLDEEASAMHGYQSLSRQSGGLFSVRSRTNVKFLADTISRFGWGVFLLPALHFDEERTKHYFLGESFPGMGARVSDYLGAGLPIICSEGIPELEALIRKFGLGLIIPRSSISTVRSMVDSIDYECIRSNVCDYVRSQFQPTIWAEKILTFYQDSF